MTQSEPPTGHFGASAATLLADVADAVHDDVPVVPLYRQTDLYAVATGLEFTPRIDRRIRAADMGWKAGREDRR